MLLSLFIPFVLAIWTASAAVQPAIDMTVGERERGTLESLLKLTTHKNRTFAWKVACSCIDYSRRRYLADWRPIVRYCLSCK